jgi:ubiquinone/menaquinone biosynthesis C-methylase UbiE
VVADYVRGRPSWPAAAIDAVGIPREAHVLDLAAGTGKLTELLLERFARVTVVEPDDEMRALNPSPDVRAGKADAIPLADTAVDAVFVAEAFHWFCDAPSVREIARVLRPGGTLALLWNRTTGDTAPAVVHELMEELRQQVGPSYKRNRYYSGEWLLALDGSGFGPMEEATFEHEHVLDRLGLVSYFMSQSQVASRPPAERDQIRARLERLIPEGRHVRQLRAELFWTRLGSAHAR